MNWSSSTIDRYGVGYLLAIARIFPEINTWASAQFLGLSLVIISFYTLYKTLRYILRSSVRPQYTLVATLFGAFSPFAIMQFQYFMFGQMLALPVLYFLIYKLASTRDTKFHAPIIVIPLFFFVSYPAMFFLSIIAIVFFYVYLVFSSRISSRIYLKDFAILSFVSILSIALSSGLALKLSFERFLIWTVTNADTSRDITWSTIKIFSQFGSSLFAPLIMGFIPYPHTVEVNPFILTSFWILGLVTVYVVWKFLRLFTISSNSLVSVICVHGTIFVLILFSFFTDKPYLSVKLATWFSPLFCSIFILWSVSLLSQLRDPGRSGIIKKSIISLLVVGLMGSTSFAYLARTTTWTNFPSILKPSEYNTLSVAGDFKNVPLLISSPTIEESMWLAGQMGDEVSSRALGLQQGSQSLGVGMNENCILPVGLRDFPKESYLLFPLVKNDIAGDFDFSFPPYALNDRFQYQKSKYLVSADVLIGSGTFPPFDLNQFNLEAFSKKGYARWSSNQVCLGIFSSKPSFAIVDFEYMQGPDLTLKKDFVAFNGLGEELDVVDVSNKIKVRIALDQGWNLLQIKQPGCYLRKLSDKWANRADDRLLCFLLSDIGFTRN